MYKLHLLFADYTSTVKPQFSERQNSEKPLFSERLKTDQISVLVLK